MGHKTATPRDLGLEEIDRWVAWFGDAQLAVIRENPDLHPAERQAALVEAERLAAAVGQRMKADYLIRQRTAPR